MLPQRFAIALAMTLSVAGAAVAQEEDGADGGKRGVHDFSFVAVPIPVANPALGNGLAVALAGLYKVGDSERPWTTGAGGFYSDSKSWAGAVFQKAYLNEDRYRATAGLGGGDFRVDFYGIGQIANRRGRAIPIETKTMGGLAEVLIRLAPNVHLGPHYRLIDTSTSFDLSQTPFADLIISELELKSATALFGLAGEYDTRDSEFAAKSGWYANGRILKADPVFGGDFSYTRAEAAVNHYRPVGRNGVLALRASVCWSGADAPFYDLCAFGSQSDLRGYTTGAYLDHAMYAVQAEYRQHLFWRIGGAVFAGVGATGRNFGSMSTADMLPAAGVGLRFLASKPYGVNARIDYAWGKGSEAIYFSVGEAF